RPAGTARSAPPSVRGPQPAGLRLEHPVHDARVVDEERFEALAGEDQAAQRSQRDHVGDGRLAKENGDLAEEVAAAEPGALVAIDDDRGLAVEDDVEGGPGEALAEDLFAFGEGGFLEEVDDGRQARTGDVGE